MKIVYTRAIDNVLCIVHGAPMDQFHKTVTTTNELGEEVETLVPFTEEEYKAEVWGKSVPIDAINPVEVDPSTLPTDREFRDAWTHDGKTFGHDLVKAKDIQLAKLRRTRDKLLDAYDKKVTQAMDYGDNNAIAALRAKKQELRDSTNALKSVDAKSIDDIKKATPDLGGYSLE